MLENHPLTWHTKFIPLLVAGLLFWAISYITGYLVTDMNALNSIEVTRYYYAHNYISFHAIFCVITICIWAFYFYKNNAFKSFYPLHRFYLARVFLQLFAAFSVLLSAHFPYTSGAIAKTKTLLLEAEISQDGDIANRAYPLLVMDKETYDIDRRVYPSPFPLSSIVRDRNDGSWNSNYHIFEAARDSSFIPAHVYTYYGNSPNATATSYTSPNPIHSIFIDTFEYQFFTTTEKHLDSDSCSNSREFIERFYDLSGVPNLHRYSLYNFSVLFTDRYGGGDPAGRDFKTDYAPTLHRWLNHRDAKSMTKALQALEIVCDKYEIKHSLQIPLLLKYLQLKNYHHVSDVTQSYASTWRNRNVFRRDHFRESQVLEAFEQNQRGAYTAGDFIFAMEMQDIYGFDESRLSTVFSNFDLMQHYMWDLELLAGIFFFAFFLAWLFLLFEFTKIISLLISIPVAGVIMILMAIFVAFYIDYLSHEKTWIYALMMTVSIFILVLTVLSLYVRILPKRLIDILINLSYFLAPAMLNIAIGIGTHVDRIYEMDRCGNNIYEDPAFTGPWWYLFYAFIGLFAYLPLIKRWKSLEA
jgi:hypothetical protein